MTVATLGTLAIVVLFLVALATAALAMVGHARGSERLVEGAVHGMRGTFAVAAFASMLLIYAFLAGDYSIQYVQHNSEASMPVFYKITAFWGSLDGSLLFWVLLLSLFSWMAISANRDRHRDLIGPAVATLAVILTFFAGLLVFMKNPFEPYLLEVPRKGSGLNPLLQNAYMIFHPPSLYLGYVSMAVPYAFGMAALVTGHVDTQWQASMRRWVLFSWLFLSTGLILGGLWAYEELGWGGYWAWDPVENAGLLPWLTCTAYFHSVMIQERRGMLKVWNMALVIISFLLTIVGTFLTRSGVVQSVHAFGRDPALAWAFGGFMIVIVVVSFGLLVWRLPLLRARNELESVLSREFAFLLNNWLFLIAAFVVLGATIYPTLTEWLDPDNRVTIATPWFDHYMPPIGLALLALMGIGPLVAWKKTSAPALLHQFGWPLAVGAVGVVIPAALGVDSAAGLACFGLSAFTLWTIVQEFVRGVAVRRKSRPQPVMEALIGLVTRARRRYGGYIVHLGVVLMFFGFAGKSYGVERKLSMRPGEVVQLGRYEVRHDGIVATEDWQKDMITVQLTVLRGGKEVASLTPARWWYYQLPEQPTTEVSRYMTAAEDVYASVAEVDLSTGWTRLNLYVNPLVNWVWVGFGVLLAGGLVCLGTRASEEREA
jgi:cytochrome c-type biogenesis protein CcmF